MGHGGWQDAGALIHREMTALAKEVIVTELAIAGRVANAEGGFPEEYTQHMVRNAGQIDPDVIVDANGVTVMFDLEESLGGQDDLTRAYHQGAVLADGTRLDGPYEGQALKQEDPEQRHIFWKALREGQNTVTLEHQGRSGAVHLQGDWDSTIQKYLQIWGSKSPQWLFIQFGQEEWEPYIPQYDIFDAIETSFSTVASTIMASVLQAITDRANSYTNAGLEVGYTSEKGPLRIKSGTVEVNGKTYSPGRFAPRGGI
jgi:hypothetical protein